MILDPPVGATPYFGFDAARAITYRNVPPRVNSKGAQGAVFVSNSGLLVMETIPLHTPDHGHVLMITTVEVFCASTSNGDTVMEFTMNIDNANAQGVSVWTVKLTAAQCAAGDSETVTVANVLPQTAGAHSVFLLARRASGSATPRLQRRTLNAVYINQNAFGW